MKLGDLLSVRKDNIPDNMPQGRILPKGEILTIKSVAKNTVLCHCPVLEKDILLWKEEASDPNNFRLVEKL